MATEEPDANRRESTGTTIYLASWESRFFAWLIDVLLVSAVLSVFGEIVGAVALFTGGFSPTTPFFSVNGLGLWLYWTGLEGSRGQSAGKMVMNIAVTDERGDDIDYVTAAIESFGKAFLLPLDVLIGWIAMEDEYLRLFNKLSSTIVVKRPDDEDVPEGVEYVPPER